MQHTILVSMETAVKTLKKHLFKGIWDNRGKPLWYQKGKTMLIVIRQQRIGFYDGSGLCQLSTPCSRQITISAQHHTLFYGPDAVPDAQPVVSKHWGQLVLKRKIKAQTSLGMLKMFELNMWDRIFQSWLFQPHRGLAFSVFLVSVIPHQSGIIPTAACLFAVH